MGDVKKMIQLYISVEDWDEAFQLAEKHPEYRELVYVPYATSLAEQDKFLQAQKAFHKAGKPDEALLTMNAACE